MVSFDGADGGEIAWTGTREGELNLGRWVVNMRSKRNANKLEPEEIRALIVAGMPWESSTRPASSKEGSSEEPPTVAEEGPAECSCSDEKDPGETCVACIRKAYSSLDDAQDVLFFVNTYLLAAQVAKKVGDKTFNLHKWYRDYTTTHHKTRWRSKICESTLRRHVRKVEARQGLPCMMLSDLPVNGAPPALAALEQALWADIKSRNTKGNPPSVGEVTAWAIKLAKGADLPTEGPAEGEKAKSKTTLGKGKKNNKEGFVASARWYVRHVFALYCSSNDKPCLDVG